jgi:hypothetical protein
VAGAAPAAGDSGDAAGVLPPGGGAAPGERAEGGPAGAQGQGQGQQLAQKGTWQYAIQKLMEMAKTGKYDGADEVISKTAKGVAGNIRGGELNSSQIEAYKTTFDNLSQTSPPKGAGGNGMQITLKNGQNQFLQFTIVKEEGSVFRIKELVIRDGKK